ncbi:MAG: septal ring lytic transglycosylase RlpA family protein [Pseudomonadota bacterium]
MMRNFLILLLAAGWLAGCSSLPRSKPAPPADSRTGGYYLDDGPGESPPPNLDQVPDAVPRAEPLHKFANRPYEVMGVTYTPMRRREAFRQTGVASWYGRRYHGKKTASGEIYDMYGMTAAHPTLPLPSYVRVTALDSGKSVIVRVNDRGPFLSDRVIDLSYAAAWKLGLLQKGSGRVSLEVVGPDVEGTWALGEAEPIRAVSLPAAAPVMATPLPAATEAAPTVRPAKPSAAGNVYVQLGAFGNVENAYRLLARAREVLAISPALAQVVLVGNLHRVDLGPFANRDEAGSWVEKSNALLGIAAITVIR